MIPFGRIVARFPRLTPRRSKLSKESLRAEWAKRTPTSSPTSSVLVRSRQATGRVFFFFHVERPESTRGMCITYNSWDTRSCTKM